jgi:hypothetical protein
MFLKSIKQLQQYLPKRFAVCMCSTNNTVAIIGL